MALSIVISIGTMILCVTANIAFNISGMLRSAYRDNMGYTTLIRTDDFSDREKIRTVLDEHGICYTYGYSKLVPYADLGLADDMDQMFWAFVVERQTDHNQHFYVPSGAFLAEKYFSSYCELAADNRTNLFGGDVLYLGDFKANQYSTLLFILIACP